MNIIVNNLQDKWKEELFQCGGFLDMQIGMEPHVIDWAIEEQKMGQKISIFMFIADNSIFKSIMQYFFSQINSAEEVFPDDESWKKNHFTVFKISVKMQIWWSNPYKMWFFGRSVTQTFF